MKITRRQLRRILSENVQEGLWDSIKAGFSSLTGKANEIVGEPDEKYLVGESTQDAYDLYKAMAGPGTDERTIEAIIQKRMVDLTVLYEEFNKLIIAYVVRKTSGFKTFSMSRLSDSQVISYNHDLIQWLEDDGMGDAATIVADALGAANIQRKNPPLDASTMDRIKGMITGRTEYSLPGDEMPVTDTK